MSHGRIRSSLSKFAAPSNGSDTDMREKARELWRYFGIVVVWPDQHLSWDTRAMVENAARKLYGEKVKSD